MRNIIKRHIYLALAFASLLLSACQREAETPDNAVRTRWTEKSVVMVTPLSGQSNMAVRMRRTAEWFITNFTKSQTTLAKGIKIKTEWYDENTVDADSLAEALKERDDIEVVIGPSQPEMLDIMATKLRNSGKAIISSMCSSEDIIRRYAVTATGTVKSPYVWTLTETDISQSEALLTMVTSGNGRSVSLVTPDNFYGKTFRDWIPFQATEMGVALTSSVTYTENDSASIDRCIREALNDSSEFVICVNDNAQATTRMIKASGEQNGSSKRLIFSNGAFDGDLINGSHLPQSINGISAYADPASGFQISYETMYGDIPYPSECMLYDALTLAALATEYTLYNDETSINEAISILTSGDKTDAGYVWDENGLTSYVTAIASRQAPPLMKGATGLLSFDSDAYTMRLSSIYTEWMCYGNRFHTLDFFTAEGTNRLSSTLSSWCWQAIHTQDLLNQDTGIEYGELRDKRAVLVCASKGWFNYRHQSDVLNMYQLLKRHGYPDDHIILICSDDLLLDGNNVYKGEIRNNSEGENLAAGVVIDYNTDTLDVNDIRDILTGRSSAHLPVVLNSDSSDNVLVYWTGHGEHNRFLWGWSDNHFTSTMMRDVMSEMSEETRYRKLLLIAEPCMSGSMTDELDGIPGVMGIASSSSTENSFAEYYDQELGVWMSDRFTNNIVTFTEHETKATYRDLYLYLVRHTFGSHAQINNYLLFDNLYTASYDEFFTY